VTCQNLSELNGTGRLGRGKTAVHQSSSTLDVRVVTPSLGLRFSGINSTLISVGSELARHIPIVATGFGLTPAVPKMPLVSALRALRRGPQRIWHARRNIEMIVGLLLRRVLRYPLILLWTSAGQRRHSWITRFCYRRMDGVVATTRKAAEYLDCPARIVYHGVDIRVYYPPADREMERKGKSLPGVRNLGLFGRIRPGKGTGDLVAALINVLPRHPEWGAVIIGQTAVNNLAYASILKHRLRAAGLQDRVRFAGFIRDFRDIPGWYRALDLVVCASRSEGFGVTCLEGMASGCPVVATTAGAWPEIVAEGEDGWLARARDPADLARALECALSTDTGTLAAMGRRAREKAVRDFSIEREAAGLLAVYHELLDPAGRAGHVGG
jgi:glycosyltransferase involved in cell wall biosynthesis